jgi:general secretion pathway protein I
MDLREMIKGRIKWGRMSCGRNIFSTIGFTLIEVVVAMAILGVALTVIIELFSGGLRLARTSAEYTKAINYARMKMEEIAVKQTMEEGTQEGEFDHTFRWQVETKKVDVLPIEKGIDFKPPTELFQVKVYVLWKSGSKERSTRLETYRTIKLEDEEKKS